MFRFFMRLVERTHRGDDEHAGADRPLHTLTGKDAWSEFDAYLAHLSSHPDPTTAIRLAHGYVEQGVGTLRPRPRTSTPFEWHATVARNDPALASELWPLTERYARIRFGGYTASSADRDQAVDTLRSLARSACR